jgi:hypothetical protein
MQLTSNFLLLAVALAYGSTAISALRVGHSSLAARSGDYEDFNAREVDDIAFLSRRDKYDDLDAREVDDIAFLARSDKYDDLNAREVDDISFSAREDQEADLFARAPGKGNRFYRYNPKPTESLGARRNFRKQVGRKGIARAANDPNHRFHSTAVNMQKEAALRKNPKLMEKALANHDHPLHRKATRMTEQENRNAFAELPGGP